MAGRRGCAAIIAADPRARIRTRSTTLDDPNATSAPPPPPPPRGPRKTPTGLRAQISATRDAVMALVMAHVELAKAEAGAIAGEVGRLAALAALAIVLVLMAALLTIIGTSLFVGEWLLGSMGWGVLHGVLLFVSVAMAAVLIGLGVALGRIGRAFLVGLVVAILVGLALGMNLPNQLYGAIGDGLGLAVDPGVLPLVVGILVVGLIGLLAGIAAAVLMDGPGGPRVAAPIGLTVLGVAIGAFTAITFGPQVGVGLGITAGYLTWIALMGIDVARTGIDVEALKNRFYPSQTIETSKETLEWLQKRMPPGIGS